MFADKRDRESLIHALNLSKELLQSINEQVAVSERKERLNDIYQKFDGRSTAMFKDKKFKVGRRSMCFTSDEFRFK